MSLVRLIWGVAPSAFPLALGFVLLIHRFGTLASNCSDAVALDRGQPRCTCRLLLLVKSRLSLRTIHTVGNVGFSPQSQAGLLFLVPVQWYTPVHYTEHANRRHPWELPSRWVPLRPTDPSEGY